MATSPLIVVCVRPTDIRPQVDSLTGTVTADDQAAILPAAEAAAIEHGMRVAEYWNGRVVVLAAGPPNGEEALREVAALGATVVRITWDSEPGEGEADEQQLAHILVAAMQAFGIPALVLCGDHSPSRGTGALPAFMAHELGAAQALGLISLEVADHHQVGVEPGQLVAERRLDGGARERLVIPQPAVCSVEAAGIRLRRAPLAALLRPSPITTVAWAGPTTNDRSDVVTGATTPFRPRTHAVAAPADEDPRQRILALTGALVAHDPPVIIGPVDAAEAADALVAFLDRNGYLDHTAPEPR